MISGKIEHGVPMPTKRGSTSPFYVDVIGFFDQLEVGDSVLFDLRKGVTVNCSTKLAVLIKIYCIIKGQQLVSKCDDTYDTVRVWRTK